MLTVKHAWIGFVMLLLVVLLTFIAMMYWQRLTGINYLHIIAQILPPDIITHGC